MGVSRTARQSACALLTHGACQTRPPWHQISPRLVACYAFSMPNPQDLLAELKKVKYPGFSRDIVSFEWSRTSR